MATDAWDRFKSGFVSLWQRVNPERAVLVEADLAEARLALLASRAAGDDNAEADITAEWRSRLFRLMSADPAVAAEVTRLVEEVRHALPALGGSVTSVTMTAKAGGHARIYQAGGDQKIVER
jgi:hypothetical protein